MTSVFGLLCGFSPSFEVLCFLLFCLGTGVGGSMPTDGMLFLENIPKTRHYLLTALSFLLVFRKSCSKLLNVEEAENVTIHFFGVQFLNRSCDCFSTRTSILAWPKLP